MAVRFDKGPHLLAEDIVIGSIFEIHGASNFHSVGKQEGGSPHRSVRTPLPPEGRAQDARDRNQPAAWPCAPPLPIQPPQPRRGCRRQKPGGGPGGLRSRKTTCPYRSCVPRKIPASRTLRTYSAASGGSCRNRCSAGNRDGRPGTSSRIPAQPGLVGAVAAWVAPYARKAAFWGADRFRCSCKPPENGDAAVAEVAPTGHEAGLGSQHLALAAVVTKLTHCLDHVVEAPDMRLTEQAAMGVDRKAATQLNLAIGDEFGMSAWFAIPHRFQLQQDDIGKAIVDLQEIHVLALDASHIESARGGIAKADLEGIGPRRDVVGGIGVAFRGTGNADGHMGHIPGPIHSRYDNRAGPIGFKAAIVKAEGLGYPAR